MIQILLLLSIAFSSVALAQSDEKPKAYLFDEFQTVSKEDLIARTDKYKAKLQENRLTKQFNDGMLFFYGDDEQSLESQQKVIREVLYKDCMDCFGFNVRITFVNAGKSEKPTTQFWIVPFGANAPEPKTEEIIK